jgi:protein O-GlcNAc transferase
MRLLQFLFGFRGRIGHLHIARAGIVATTFLLLAWMWGSHQFGIPGPLHMVDRLLMPHDLAIFWDRQANVPAMQAEQDGRAAARRGDHAAAIAHFTRAIELHGEGRPAAADALGARASERQKAGQLPEALDDYTRSIALDPRASSYYGRGLVYRAMDRHADALTDFDSALRLSPDYAAAIIARGQALERLGRTQEALAAYAAAIPAAERAFESDVTLWEGIEKDKSADAGWRARLQRERDDRITLAHVRRGRALGGLRRHDEALKAYEEAIRVNADDRHIYVNRGWLYEGAGQRDLALADYEKAASLGPGDEWLTRAIERMRRPH